MEATKLASACSSTSRVGVFNHFGTVSAIVGVWFGAMCVSGIGDPLPKRQTLGICDGHEDLSSC